MNALGPLIKTSLPGFSDLQRKFGTAADGEDETLRRLVLTLDITLTDIHNTPKYRAAQAGVFINLNHDKIATLFSYARVITCDSLPRVGKSGAFENNIGVWVREQDAENAVALLGGQNWITRVEPETTHIVRAGIDYDTSTLSSGAIRRRPSDEARPSL